jgi:FkbM family methyltransferase
MFQKIIASMAKSIRPLKKVIEDKVEESKFEQKVQDALQNPFFERVTNIVRFTYEGQQLFIKIPDIRDYISLNIVSKGTFFDIEDLESLRDKIPVGAVVIDAGSNIGNHALYYGKICKAASVYCFEPQERIFNLLGENIRLNELMNVVTAYKLALGDHVAKASSFFQDDVAISSKKKQVNYGGLYLKEDNEGAFEITTLDTFLLPVLTRLDYIKLDVQGFEDKVIRGGKDLIRKFHPVIQVECMDKKILNTEILPLMQSLDYRITRVFEIDYLFEPVQ